MSAPAPPPVVELERRLRWPLLPALLFMLDLAALLALAIVTLVVPPRHPRGLCDDPRARAAADSLAGRVPVATGELRFSAAVLGGEPADHAPDTAELARVAAARPLLVAALRAHAGDPRAQAALAAADLVRHDEAAAVRRYRAACERAPRYGEGRLGLGVALALWAERTPDVWQARALRLEAIAQFAAVDPADAEYRPALYDRARVLLRVGRAAEAGRWARRYLALEPAGPWAERLRAGMAGVGGAR